MKQPPHTNANAFYHLAEEEPAETEHLLPAEVVIGNGETLDDADQQPSLPEVLPILPVRQMVIFSGTIIPLNIGRSASRQLLDDWLPRS